MFRSTPKTQRTLSRVTTPLVWLAISTIRISAADSFLLEAGTGCEHIVVASSPEHPPVAITTRTEHRAFRRAPEESLGFAFLGLKSGYPVLLGTQSPEDFPPLKGKTIEPHTWQALDWSPACSLAGGRELLAVAGTSGRYNGNNSKPQPCVEFFVWDRKHARTRPRLKRFEKLDSTPLLSSGCGTNINALVLSGNGDVYASVLSPNPFARLNVICESLRMNPGCKQLLPNSIYLWRPGMDCWIRVARGIPTANGLYLAMDGRTLCVNSFSKRAIIRFARDKTTGLLSQPETCYLPTRNNPDNLSSLDNYRASAMATPGLQSGGALLLGGIFGTNLGLRPSATIWEIDTRDRPLRPKIVGNATANHGVFSDATRFGNWWLCGNMLGEGIHCMPIAPQ